MRPRIYKRVCPSVRRSVRRSVWANSGTHLWANSWPCYYRSRSAIPSSILYPSPSLSLSPSLPHRFDRCSRRLAASTEIIKSSHTRLMPQVLSHFQRIGKKKQKTENYRLRCVGNKWRQSSALTYWLPSKSGEPGARIMILLCTTPFCSDCHYWTVSFHHILAASVLFFFCFTFIFLLFQEMKRTFVSWTMQTDNNLEKLQTIEKDVRANKLQRKELIFSKFWQVR